MHSFATALPTIALFGLKLKRLPQLIGVLSYFVIGAVLILQWKSTWYRNILQVSASFGSMAIVITLAHHSFPDYGLSLLLDVGALHA
jgi:hypothetical protein